MLTYGRSATLDTFPPKRCCTSLRPRKGRHGLIDYEKTFCPDTRSGPDIFDVRGIDRARGCLVLVRPDQFVAHVLPLQARAELAAFFDGFLQGAQ